MSEGHVCKCKECHPNEFSSGPRQGPNHIGLRFPDRTYAEQRARPSLNGKLMLLSNEFLAGPNGWIRRHGLNYTHKCKCGYGVCEEILHGNVTVEMDDVPRDIESRMYYMEAHKHEFRCREYSGVVTNLLETDAEYRALGLALRLKRFQRCPACDQYCTSIDGPHQATVYSCGCGWGHIVTEKDLHDALHRDDVYYLMALSVVLRERMLSRT